MTTGLISEGQEVEWRGRHFGLWWKMRVRITKFEAPSYFQDTMVKGPFRRFVHDHFFEPQGADTRMTDKVKFESPVPILGPLFDVILINKYLLRFLQARNAKIKAGLEAPSWHK